ncbi:MAG: hypothetical protein ACREAR_06510 [Nitrosotalea sp.]
MKKSSIILITLAFTMILTTLIVNSIPALAFNKHGPTPIPGNLFPHPGILHNSKTSKHADEKLHSLQVLPST